MNNHDARDTPRLSLHSSPPRPARYLVAINDSAETRNNSSRFEPLLKSMVYNDDDPNEMRNDDDMNNNLDKLPFPTTDPLNFHRNFTVQPQDYPYNFTNSQIIVNNPQNPQFPSFASGTNMQAPIPTHDSTGLDPEALSFTGGQNLESPLPMAGKNRQDMMKASFVFGRSNHDSQQMKAAHQKMKALMSINHGQTNKASIPIGGKNSKNIEAFIHIGGNATGRNMKAFKPTSGNENSQKMKAPVPINDKKGKNIEAFIPVGGNNGVKMKAPLLFGLHNGQKMKAPILMSGNQASTSMAFAPTGGNQPSNSHAFNPKELGGAFRQNSYNVLASQLRDPRNPNKSTIAQQFEDQVNSGKFVYNEVAVSEAGEEEYGFGRDQLHAIWQGMMSMGKEEDARSHMAFWAEKPLCGGAYFQCEEQRQINSDAKYKEKAWVKAWNEQVSDYHDLRHFVSLHGPQPDLDHRIRVLENTFKLEAERAGRMEEEDIAVNERVWALHGQNPPFVPEEFFGDLEKMVMKGWMKEEAERAKCLSKSKPEYYMAKHWCEKSTSFWWVGFGLIAYLPGLGNVTINGKEFVL